MASSERHGLPGDDVVVETENLTKVYGTRTAVDHVRMTVRRGEIYGFLGRNGAGKTTTLRMLLGLVRPTAGSARVLDEPPGAPVALARTGMLVEAPAFYPYLSGEDNLRVFAAYAKAPRSRVGEVLETVGLTDRSGDRVSAYSLGMRQRLGIAVALLKDPQLLVLDEPSNGLDPAAMSEMRALFRRLAGTQGRTVVLSSHLLADVQAVCDRVGVLDDGILLVQDAIGALCGPGSVRIVGDPLPLARRVAERVVGIEKVTVRDCALDVEVEDEEVPVLNRELVLAGVAVSMLARSERSLEDLFFELTGRDEESD